MRDVRIPWPPPSPLIIPPLRRKVFISYHHRRDQWAYDLLAEQVCERMELFTDRSLDVVIDSEDDDYIQRAIRERHIRGSSATIVLCGPETWKRMHVDHEIRSTLDLEHGLVGLVLPTASRELQTGAVIVPDRLYDNWRTGYASLLDWTLDTAVLDAAVEAAVRRWRELIDNRRPKMEDNLR